MKRNNSFEATFETSDTNFYRNYKQANIILNYTFLLETNKSTNSIVFQLISADKHNSGKRFPLYYLWANKDYVLRQHERYSSLSSVLNSQQLSKQMISLSATVTK